MLPNYILNRLGRLTSTTSQPVSSVPFLLDREQIRQLLKLMPQDRYLAQNNLRLGDRRSGQTTEMILDILAASQTRKIFVNSINRQSARSIVRNCKILASRLNNSQFDPNNIDIFINDPSRYRGIDPRSYQIFDDHSIRYANQIEAERLTMAAATLVPIVCQGCANYNGSTYGGNLLICAIHPYGCDAEACADWEAN